MYFFSSFIIFLLGLCLGSFLITFLFRTHSKKSILKERSACDNCHQKIWWRDLIPVLSFLFLKQRCRFCEQKISWKYPVVEFLTGVLFLGIFAFHPEFSFSKELFRDFFIVFFLEIIFLSDIWYGEIPLEGTFFPAFLVGVGSLVFGWHTPGGLLKGVLFGGGFFGLQFLLSRGKGIGEGDIAVGIFMGVILGWPLTLIAVFLAYIGAAVVLVPFFLLKKINKQSKIPFGTFLVPATLFTLLFGQTILKWWNHIF